MTYRFDNDERGSTADNDADEARAARRTLTETQRAQHPYTWLGITGERDDARDEMGNEIETEYDA